MSVKDEVKKKIAEAGGLTAGDLASFDSKDSQQGEGTNTGAENKTQDANESTDRVEVSKEAAEDVVRKAYDASTPEDVVASALANNPSGLYFENNQVDVTPEDKEAFLRALIDDSRFERPFTIFNGKVSGVFRSRLLNETRAIMCEIQRQLRNGEFDTDIEYGTRMRHALLRFQLKELDGKSYQIPEEPLSAVATVEDGKEKVTPPAWVEEADVFFNGSEAKFAAVYAQLCVFEAKYWTMTQNADDQDFWQTEDSTSE